MLAKSGGVCLQCIIQMVWHKIGHLRGRSRWDSGTLCLVIRLESESSKASMEYLPCTRRCATVFTEILTTTLQSRCLFYHIICVNKLRLRERWRASI